MLEYENQMFLDILHDDGIVVCAKGLSLENVFVNIIKVYCDPGNLVIILGANLEEAACVVSELESQSIYPKIITSDISVAEREKLYRCGGVLFISSRIVVVDLLKKRLPIKLITGFLVWRAQKILHLHQDAFALRLYRLENKSGFVKAFCSSAETFTHSITGIRNVMKTLFVRNLSLWPRFHSLVHANIEKNPSNVIELRIKLTGYMFKIQTALLKLIRYTVSEIHRLNPRINNDEITVEDVLSNSFHMLLKIHLDPIWNQLSEQTKNLISDLKLFKHLLLSLYEMDSMQFHRLVNSLRSAEYVQRSSGWMLLDMAEELFISAKGRVQNLNEEGVLEFHPKWEILRETLKEIRLQSETPEVVIVLVKNIETCGLLKKYLINGPKKLTKDLHQKYLNKDGDNSSSIAEFFTTNKDDKEKEELQSESFTLTQNFNSDTGNVVYSERNSNPESDGAEPIVILEHFRKENNWHFRNLLKSSNASHIILYDVDITRIRQIEAHQASYSKFKMTVFILMFENSVEEQAFLTSVHREKKAFEFLIQEKSTMSVTVDQDGKSDEFSRESKLVGTVEENTRKAGGNEISKKSNPIVIVDMREFRSELPVLLHGRLIDIEPVTLQIGDYILTPEICVERKSVNDLIGSLNSGRLYQQVLSMTRYYSKPILLIEFNVEKAFGFNGNYYSSNSISTVSIYNKLQLLTLHFPKLRIFWSPSPHISAQLFQEIKDGKEEPNSSVAAVVGNEIGLYDDDKYNSAIRDFVSKLPGITSQNIFAVLNNCSSLQHLTTLSKDVLTNLLQSSVNADLLYNALHTNYEFSQKKQPTTASNKFKYKFRAKKKN